MGDTLYLGLVKGSSGTGYQVSSFDFPSDTDGFGGPTAGGGMVMVSSPWTVCSVMFGCRRSSPSVVGSPGYWPSNAIFSSNNDDKNNNISSETSNSGSSNASSHGSKNSNSQIAINYKNGIEFEKSLIDELKHVGAEKNTTEITVRLADGREVKTIVDISGKNVGGMIEAKNVVDLSLSPQFKAQVMLAQETGQPLNLVISPRNKTISKNLVSEIKKTGGEIYVYDPIVKTIKKI